MNKISKHILLVILFLFSSFYSFCQKKMFTDGELPSDMIYQITQDYDGFMWFATDRGIVKYDGSTTKVFTIKDGLPSNDIWMINVTENNKIWYYSKNHIQGYIYKDSVFAFEHEDKNKVFKVESYIQNKEDILYWDSPGTDLCKLKNNKWRVISKSTHYNKDTFKNYVINKYGIKDLVVIKDSICIQDNNN